MALMKYNRILRHKNELLKNFAMAPADKSMLLDKYDQDLIPLIQKIGMARQAFEENFEPVFQDFYSQIATIDTEISGFKYEHSIPPDQDRKSTRLNSSHVANSYAVFCLKKKI